MRLNDEVVVAEFDGGKIILIVDNTRILDGNVVCASDLYGYDKYLIDIDLNSYNFRTGETTYDYSLSFHYFEVARSRNLEPVYLNKEIMEKYNLTKDCEIDKELLLKIEDDINNKELEDKKKTNRR